MSRTEVDPEPVASHRGPNGVEVEIFDASTPYGYTNIFRVRLRVTARVPGAPEPYVRWLERFGVTAANLARVRGELLEAFEVGSLPYLLGETFPERFSEHLRRVRQRAARLPGAA